MIVISSFAFFFAFFYGIYSLIRFLMARNDKEASEETKALWKKKCLIAAAVFVVSFIVNFVNSIPNPNPTPEEKAAQEEARRLYQRKATSHP